MHARGRTPVLIENARILCQFQNWHAWTGLVHPVRQVISPFLPDKESHGEGRKLNWLSQLGGCSTGEMQLWPTPLGQDSVVLQKWYRTVSFHCFDGRWRGGVAFLHALVLLSISPDAPPERRWCVGAQHIIMLYRAGFAKSPRSDGKNKIRGIQTPAPSDSSIAIATNVDVDWFVLLSKVRFTCFN